MTPNNIKLVEELVPRIRPMQDGETTPEYLNYISDVIDGSLFNNELGLIDMERSPVFKIWKMFAKPEPFKVPTNFVFVGDSNVPSVDLANAEVVAD